MGTIIGGLGFICLVIVEAIDLYVEFKKLRKNPYTPAPQCAAGQDAKKN